MPGCCAVPPGDGTAQFIQSTDLSFPRQSEAKEKRSLRTRIRHDRIIPCYAVDEVTDCEETDIVRLVVLGNLPQNRVECWRSIASFFQLGIHHFDGGKRLNFQVVKHSFVLRLELINRQVPALITQSAVASLMLEKNFALSKIFPA